MGFAKCHRCGKRVATFPSTGRMRPHAVPIDQRPDPARYSRCEGDHDE